MKNRMFRLTALLLALLDEFTRQRGGERVTHSDFLLLSAITLHNIPEGMAVGLAFALAADGEGLAGAAALALGIGVQNFPARWSRCSGSWQCWRRPGPPR